MNPNLKKNQYVATVKWNDFKQTPKTIIFTIKHIFQHIVEN